MPAEPRLTFLFVDGVGLSDDARSPLRTALLPSLSRLTDGFSAHPFDRPGLAYRVLDATLGIDGLPQSATGQTTLLTGVNAASALGRHQGPHPGSTLQALLGEQSLQVWAARRGRRVFHANGYRADYLARLRAARRNMRSAFAFAAEAAGGSLLDLDDPRAHRPGFWTEPGEAGRSLAEASAQHHLTVFEYWALDYTGHREVDAVPAQLEQLDAFVSGYLDANADATLVLTSDHGNAEETWHTHHTRNPVPLIVAGAAAASVPRSMTSLVDVAGWIRQVLSPEAASPA